jgi:integrase
MARARGTGSIFRMKGSQNWWIKYYKPNGEAVRESCNSAVKGVATNLLKQRFTEMGRGMDPAVANKLTYEDIRKGLLDHYTAKKRSSLKFKFNEETQKKDPYVWGMPHLDDFFKGWRVVGITHDVLQAFVEKRKEDGAEGSTINRNFTLLRSMFNIARKQGKLQFVPAFPMQSDGAPRQGFVEPNQFKDILDKLPKHLHPLLIFLYSSGVRIGEAKQIMWPQVDLKTKEIHLEGFQTKNKSGRTAPLSEELVGLLKKQFHTNDGPVFDTRNLRKEWDKATAAAKVRGILIHDLRRSAVRNMMKAGIRESIAMKISGHKTANIFRRYDIVDSSDLHAAMDAVSKMYASEVKK